jgi:hypothetical protein
MTFAQLTYRESATLRVVDHYNVECPVKAALEAFGFT